MLIAVMIHSMGDLTRPADKDSNFIFVLREAFVSRVVCFIALTSKEYVSLRRVLPVPADRISAFLRVLRDASVLVMSSFSLFVSMIPLRERERIASLSFNNTWTNSLRVSYSLITISMKGLHSVITSGLVD